MKTRNAKHLARSAHMVMHATPERIFPLLCPVLEYDWIPGWECTLMHSVSGVAEKDCVFVTELPGRGTETWICTRYEPPHAIEYARWSDIGMVTRLTITLAPDGPATTRMQWTTTRTSLSLAGDELLDALADGGYEQDITTLEDLLAKYLADTTAA